MNDAQARAHCADLVRAQNRPRFVAGLFAPEAKRRSLYALYALDEELLNIPRAAPQPLIAAMRYQWWRDALEKLPGETRGHPVLGELAAAIAAGHAGAAAFVVLIDAREEGEGAEGAAIALAAAMLGEETGDDAVARELGAAIETRAQEKLADARTLWKRERRAKRARLPAYLPATTLDMPHPVSPLALHWRMLRKALANAF